MVASHWRPWVLIALVSPVAALSASSPAAYSAMGIWRGLRLHTGPGASGHPDKWMAYGRYHPRRFTVREREAIPVTGREARHREIDLRGAQAFAPIVTTSAIRRVQHDQD